MIERPSAYHVRSAQKSRLDRKQRPMTAGRGSTHCAVLPGGRNICSIEKYFIKHFSNTCIESTLFLIYIANRKLVFSVYLTHSHRPTIYYFR